MEANGAEIVFFDVETTVPSRSGERFALLEFGAILVCPRRLVEVGCYSTLIRPADLAAISSVSIRCNGIGPDVVSTAPTFHDVADRVFDVLNGRVWAGHNIIRFDCPRIREAFEEIGLAAPEPKGIIDTLPLLTQKFGRRAGDMKMASMATYFGLGQQKHRSLDDVRMNLEVLKCCAAVLFLEVSLPDVFSLDNLVPNGITSRTATYWNASHSQQNLYSPSDEFNDQQINRHILNTSDQAGPSTPVCEDLSNMAVKMNIDLLQSDTQLAQITSDCDIISTSVPTENSHGYAGFLEVDQVLPNKIRAPTVQSSRKIVLLYRECPLQLFCMGMMIHFGVNSIFIDYAGRPKLSIVVGAPENLCKVLDICDQIAQVASQNSGSNSEWRPVLKRLGHSNTFTIRLHIPTVANGDGTIYSTEIYHKDPSGNMQKLVFSRLDASELETIFVPGTTVDAYFNTDIYDFQQNAGIKLVARRLVVVSK
ncbi:protein NEN1-like isoform X1 [Zingiber officinale]|uniref:protein NEN1-like isoform X1 n=1 Tax=Zingiber officinale TaxID=94328 RepID=UPI001C4B6103|nr:protein NEN1-like isoform X1 [Zingiber officinale]XP_042376835.1 protein NEN1-like isoform X1 [Zingiber officinale]